MARQPRKLSPAQVDALDRDDNGEAGGSKPKPKLTKHEFEAICAEAFEAYDFQDERVRYDTLGRRWTFRPDKRGTDSVLSLGVSQLGQSADDTISTALLASDLGREMIADVVTSLASKL